MRVSALLLSVIVLVSGCTAGPVSLPVIAQPSKPSHSAVPRLSPSFTMLEYTVPTPNSGPLSIVAGPDGALWFTEAFAPNIGRIDVNGNIREYPVGGHGQNFLAVGPDKNLWFTQSGPDVIGRLTTGGALTEFPVSSPTFALEKIARGPDKRMWFENIAQDNGDVYVDAITLDGSIQQYGPVDQSCYFPFGMTVGSDGNLWAVGGPCLSKITPNGQITSTDLGPNIGLSLVTHARDGDLWASDDGSSPPAIDQITLAGGVTKHVLSRAKYNLYGVLEVGTKIYFAEQGADQIGRIDESTFTVREFPVPTPNAEPSTLAKGPDGNIWFTEFNTNKIGVLILR